MNYTIAGIPCTIDDIKVTVVKPDSRADSDWDYYGYTDVEYTVCDRRGRPAPWLECKLTAESKSLLEEAIVKHEDDRRAF